MNNNLLWILGAYLLGSIPTGLLLGKLYGIDVRKEGSGNIGATNLYRTVGRKVGIMTLVGDCLKGLLPVILAWKLGLLEPMQAWIGLAAFCGHVFSVFLLFKGGKGVATALGVFLALSPLAVLGALAVFILLVAIWRYISLGSIVAAAVMPLIIWFRPHSIELLIATALISAIVIIKHHTNINRLIAGTESKFKA
ncbi:acyl-phosphate glycerol-3-phosphate acyltransferase [Trichlorobacter thiogenes]|uniref:Glycerol-3-phosphate acyltransferase n=1 Tax=Trichlorobacter thiogenes TaxID=115783 RepID=A0A1T4NW27_9BACT|nr:glycerol-3-phosphate 1-O-acyltransferase PlsY [Trichlorobacter thiogenes]SJZ83484.1 acyl-phosphate glycerol-3-phosphate acyltransferase [Trichlorobacter thiogenes]